jgi:hypothetical protein
MTKRIIKETFIPNAEHLVPVYVVNYKIQLFGSHYYIYDFAKFDIVKNEDGSDMKVFHQDQNGRADLILHCQKLLKEDFEKQEALFNKKKLALALQQEQTRGTQSL